MALRGYFTVALIACAYVGVIQNAPVDEVIIVPLAEPDNYRLPLTIFPESYNISLKPYLLESDGPKRFTFDGDVEIVIKPKVTTRYLAIHSKNLKYNVREMWSKTTPATKIPLNNFVENSKTNIFNYTLTSDLIANQEYVLHFNYNGTMDDDMHGFYRSSYKNSKNETKWLASTQFQTNHARRAFPSFDEPKFKAVFDVSIRRHKSMKSFSNTHSRISTREGDYFTDVFTRTPRMSTYLLAFIVSEFNERSNGDFGVIARPEYYAQTEYSFDVGQEILTALSDYFNISYYDMGIDKMHMAAIPDFSAGAMENWGLLTYRERGLLYEEGSTTLNAKQYIAAVVAHEQTHMWFGDYVTCDWWSVAWLNEGFARYFQTYGTAMVEKHFDLENQFIVDQIQTVMAMDSTNGTNPLTDPNTNTPEEIGRQFNSITYNKGATFIRMVKHILGEENFRKSLQNYLKKYNLNNTVPRNLFDEWAAFWPQEFNNTREEFFESYTTQVGYPVVQVTVANDRRSIQFSQNRFLINEHDTQSNASLSYTVPITYTTGDKKDFVTTKPKFFLQKSPFSVSDFTANISWVIANIQETGYYRVNYDERNWHDIHHALLANSWSGIHELNRAQIVDDLLNLARASIIHYNLTLSILEYLETETNYLPWTAAFNGYSYLAIRLGTDTREFGHYLRQLMNKAYTELGFEERKNDTALDIYNRAKLISWSCKYGNTQCISKALSYFHNHNEVVPVNIRAAVYCTAMREGTENDFNTLFTRFKTTTIATEETLILNSLGCVKDSKLVERYFHIIVSDEVRRQDKSSALTSLYTENNENVTPVFRLVTKNVDSLAKSLGSYSSVASVISSIASRFTEESQKKELEEFNKNANKDNFGSSYATLESAVKTVETNLKWSSEKLGSIRTYLSIRKTNNAAANTIAVLTVMVSTLVAMLLL